MSKIVQIAGGGDRWNPSLYALCEDGTVWHWEGGAWMLMPALPQRLGQAHQQKNVYYEPVCKEEAKEP